MKNEHREVNGRFISRSGYNRGSRHERQLYNESGLSGYDNILVIRGPVINC